MMMMMMMMMMMIVAVAVVELGLQLELGLEGIHRFELVVWLPWLVGRVLMGRGKLQCMVVFFVAVQAI